MDIVEEQTIWFPGIYRGRTEEEWTQLASVISNAELIHLVQKRALYDGTWCIDQGLVGENNENEDKMRLMMAFVSNEKHIRQCLEHIRRDNKELERTVDWVCRELADASKFMIP